MIMEKLHSPVGKNNLHAYGSGSKVHNFILQQGLFGLLSLITRVLSVWAHCKVVCGFYQHSGLYLQWGSDWKLLTLDKKKVQKIFRFISFISPQFGVYWCID